MTWTVKDIEEAAEKVLAEVGNNHVYSHPLPNFDGCSTCFYQYYGQPQCFVGHIFNVLGVDMKELALYEGNNVLAVIQSMQLSLTLEAIAFLENIQLEQDCRESWDNALRSAANR